MAIGSEYASIVSSSGLNLSAIALERIHWRPKRKYFACFSSQVHESVQEIEKHEAIVGVSILKPHGRVILGSSILCFLPEASVNGFIMKRVNGGYLVSLPHARRWVARDQWIAFDPALQVWVAKGSEGFRGSRVDA